MKFCHFGGYDKGFYVNLFSSLLISVNIKKLRFNWNITIGFEAIKYAKYPRNPNIHSVINVPTQDPKVLWDLELSPIGNENESKFFTPMSIK